jgi:hypothetical protein
MQGIGGRVKGGAYIVGLDSETGKRRGDFTASPGQTNLAEIPGMAYR